MFFVDLPIQAPPPAYHYEYLMPAKDTQEKHLIPKTQLFVDVNWTITCFDSYGYDTMTDEQLHTIFCIDVARQITRVWEPGLEKMSYYTYVRYHLYPVTSRCSEDEAAALHHLQEQAYATVFERLNGEEREYWLDKVQRGKEKHRTLAGHKVFPSFIKLIQYYREEESFQIVLRTFGEDGLAVVKEIHDRLGYPFFNTDLYKLRYVNDEYYSLQLEGQPEEMIARKDLATRIYQLGNCVIQDDYSSWSKSGKTSAFGKPFPIDLNPEFKRFFFDDWAWLRGILSPYHAETGECLDLSDQFVPRITTLDMLLDDNIMLNILKGEET